MKIISFLALVLLVSAGSTYYQEPTPAPAQPPMSVIEDALPIVMQEVDCPLIVDEPVPVTFLLADSAIVTPNGNRVAILAENLDPVARFGALLRVSNQANDWIEVHPADTFFPVRVLRPLPEAPGEYLIEGQPGESYWVSIRSTSGIPPEWIKITIQGKTPPTDPTDPVDPTDPPPTTDFAALKQEAKQRADAIGDALTRSQLQKAYQTAAQEARASGSVSEAGEKTRILVGAVMLNRSRATRETYGEKWFFDFLSPIEGLLTAQQFVKAATYADALDAIADGLQVTATAESVSKITMLSPPNCARCQEWKDTVMPTLVSKGWLIEFQEASELLFVVCVNGKCQQIKGFMDIAAFSVVVEALRR